MSTTSTKTLTMVHREDLISPLTWRARRNATPLQGWYDWTQLWVWEGGDAIVMLAGFQPYVIIRVGEHVRVLMAASVREAMAVVGLDAQSYTVQ